MSKPAFFRDIKVIWSSILDVDELKQVTSWWAYNERWASILHGLVMMFMLADEPGVGLSQARMQLNSMLA